jgi:arginyl-tRNA synthetase
MNIEQLLKQKIADAIQTVFEQETDPSSILLQETNKDFVGDYTFVTFGLAKSLKMGPPIIANKLSEQLNTDSFIESTNVVQGFLNIKLSEGIWYNLLKDIQQQATSYWQLPATGQKVVVEYSSPNTNKPLHLGHLRNNFLGYSISEILSAVGHQVVKTSVVNNRGIHICKSMLAYQKFGNGNTPESEGLKPDHLVGKYYVAYDQAFKKEVEALTAQGIAEEEAKKQAPILLEAQNMLLEWEKGNPEVHALWEKMNQWVYDGFADTYKKIGVDFAKTYYESDLYLDGKKTVEKGLADGVFFQKEDNSIWIDLSNEGLDQKLVQRKDGTAVYITQDLGLADKKYEDFGMDRSVYVVGNEQDYHFEVLFKIMQKLGRPFADNLFHLSYGMVDLPSGKMKSREGTVVDADELIDEMRATAKAKTEELGKTEGFSNEELTTLYHTLGMGALKYFLLKVDPKKRMLFNPAESIEFQGNTGPFIQYTFARTNAILRKAKATNISMSIPETVQPLTASENNLIQLLGQYPSIIRQAAEAFSPAIVANYNYEMAKAFNSFYTEVSILGETNEQLKQMRVGLTQLVSETISNGMRLLGITVPERM